MLSVLYAIVRIIRWPSMWQKLPISTCLSIFTLFLLACHVFIIWTNTLMKEYPSHVAEILLLADIWWLTVYSFVGWKYDNGLHWIHATQDKQKFVFTLEKKYMFWIVPSKEIINEARLRRLQSNYKGKFQSFFFQWNATCNVLIFRMSILLNIFLFKKKGEKIIVQSYCKISA